MMYQAARNQANASADFAKLGNKQLGKRFLRACSYELLFAYLIAVAASINLKNGRYSVLVGLFSARTIGYTAASYLVGLATLVVHGQLFRVTRSPHSSHFPKLQRLLRSPAATGTAIGAYTAMSYFMMVVHGWMFGGHATRMWLYPEGSYGPPQLNPAWLASCVLATVLGCSYGAQLVMDERLQLSFPAVDQGRVYVLKDRLPGGFARALAFAFGVQWRFCLVYFFSGWCIYRSVCGVLARAMTTSAYGMSNPLLSPSGLAFWLLSGTLTTLAWELAHRLFEVVATEPTRICSLSQDPNACLLNGLRHRDSPLIQHLAYQELYRLTMFSAEQRKGLLTDIDRQEGTMWRLVSAQCMDVIRTATGQLRAQNPPKESKPPGPSKLPAKPTEPPAQSRAGGAPMKDILQQGRKAGQALPLAPAKPTVAPQELFGPEAQGLEKYVLTLVIDMLVQSAVGQRILKRSLRAQSTSALSNFQLQVWAVRSLMRLVECSISEDSFGLVQKDIALVLSTMFAYLAELERCAASHSGGPGCADYTVQTTNRQALAMVQVVRNSLYAFTTSFYVYLEALKLPQDVGRQLQVFANFQA